MSSVSLDVLLGARPSPFKWERLALYVAAAIMSDLLWGILNHPIVRPGYAGLMDVSWFYPLTPWEIILLILTNLLRGLVVLAALAWIRNLWGALATGALVYAVLRWPLTGWVISQAIGDGRGIDFPHPLRVLTIALAAFITLACVAVALQRTASLLRALAYGLVAGSLLSNALTWVYGMRLANDTSELWGPRLAVLLASLIIKSAVPALLQAALWYAGLHLSRTLDADARVGRVPRAPFLGLYAAVGGVLALSTGMLQLLAARGITLQASLERGDASIVGQAAAAMSRGFFVLTGLRALLLVGVSAIVLVFVHRMWSALRDEGGPNPGAACGFLLVPIFNVYWFMRMFQQYAVVYNAAIARRGLAAPPLAPRRFLALAIIAMVGTLAAFYVPFASLIPWACTLALFTAVAASQRALDGAAPTPA